MTFTYHLTQKHLKESCYHISVSIVGPPAGQPEVKDDKILIPEI